MASFNFANERECLMFLAKEFHEDWERISNGYCQYRDFLDHLNGVTPQPSVRELYSAENLRMKYEILKWEGETAPQTAPSTTTVPAEPTLTAAPPSATPEDQPIQPSGFNILKHSLKADVDAIHDHVRANLPSVPTDEGDEEDDASPVVFRSGRDWETEGPLLDRLAKGDLPEPSLAALTETAEPPPASAPAPATEPAAVAAESTRRSPSRSRGLRGWMPNLLSINEVHSAVCTDRKFFRPSERDAEEDFVAMETDEATERQLDAMTEEFFRRVRTAEPLAPPAPGKAWFNLEKDLEGIDLDGILADCEAGKLTAAMLDDSPEDEDFSSASIAEMVSRVQALASSIRSQVAATASRGEGAANGSPAAPATIPTSAPTPPPPRAPEAEPPPPSSLSREAAEKGRERRGRWTVVEYDDDDEAD
eukprot:EG_transcript_10400